MMVSCGVGILDVDPLSQEITTMPHLLRFSREIESRLERASKHTGITKAELIERLVQDGLTDLEAQLLLEDAASRTERSIDQLLRESGLGA
ncbi:hypothetical protein [Halomonas aquatica]|uniref:Ribbon-helix-helix protein CopG domain-containing protein n=1 Tax=Halomonas aquatica TaxID=3151123 RepID=A0ABV1NEB9_9GAMM